MLNLSTAVLGGADGPTAIFLATNFWSDSLPTVAVGVGALISCSILLYLFKRKK